MPTTSATATLYVVLMIYISTLCLVTPHAFTRRADFTTSDVVLRVLCAVTTTFCPRVVQRTIGDLHSPQQRSAGHHILGPPAVRSLWRPHSSHAQIAHRHHRP